MLIKGAVIEKLIKFLTARVGFECVQKQILI